MSMYEDLAANGPSSTSALAAGGKSLLSVGNAVKNMAGGNSLLSVGNAVKNMAGNMPTMGSLSSSLSSLRTSASNLLNGGDAARAAANIVTKPPKISYIDAAGKLTTDSPEWRIRVSLAQGAKYLYKDSGNTLLQPLVATDGVIFPFTPQLITTHSAKYSAASLTHSNYAMQFYEGSEVSTFSINGEFPAQNIIEGQYLLAAIYFFRSSTKMFWGNDDQAGAPPPVLFLSGLGDAYYPSVPCVLTNFTHTIDQDKDFIEVPDPSNNGNTTWLPTLSTLQIQLQPIYSRKAMTQFTMYDFSDGGLLDNGFV